MATPGITSDSYVGLFHLVGRSTKPLGIKIRVVDANNPTKLGAYNDDDLSLDGIGHQVELLDTSGEILLTVDRARFRKSLVTQETLIQSDRAFNGNIIFTTTGKVKFVEEFEE